MRGRVAIVVVAVVATLLGSAIFASSISTWSGYYLRTSDNHKIHYNAATGAITDMGEHTPPELGCERTTDPAIIRCGVCDHYAPPGELTWASSSTQFLYDACANFDARNQHEVFWRTDLRLYDGFAETYFPAGSIHRMDVWRVFYYVENGQYGEEPDYQTVPPCSSLPIGSTAQLSVCESGVRKFNDEVPPGTYQVCYYVALAVQQPSGMNGPSTTPIDPCYPVT